MHNACMQVLFHDSTRARKAPLLTDYYGFTLGSLSSHGALYASPPGKDTPTSMLVYRPHETWAPHSDWNVALSPGEVAVCIAAGECSHHHHDARLEACFGNSIGWESTTFCWVLNAWWWTEFKRV
jgi:hypothetical protein